jgi:hypothetical protein
VWYHRRCGRLYSRCGLSDGRPYHSAGSSLIFIASPSFSFRCVIQKGNLPSLMQNVDETMLMSVILRFTLCGVPRHFFFEKKKRKEKEKGKKKKKSSSYLVRIAAMTRLEW